MRYAHVRNVKSLFTNIPKQHNMLKISLLFKKFTNFTGNNSRFLRIKNANFSRYCFYINTNIYWDFQICVSVLLRNKTWFNRDLNCGSLIYIFSFRFSESNFLMNLRRQFCVRKIFSRRQLRTQVFVGFAVFSVYVQNYYFENA